MGIMDMTDKKDIKSQLMKMTLKWFWKSHKEDMGTREKYFLALGLSVYNSCLNNEEMLSLSKFMNDFSVDEIETIEKIITEAL